MCLVVVPRHRHVPVQSVVRNLITTSAVCLAFVHEPVPCPVDPMLTSRKMHSPKKKQERFFQHTMVAKIITVLTRYRPLVLELI